MKKLFLILSLLIVPLVITTTGCKTPTPQTIVYKTLYAVETTVDTAYKSYLDLVVTGKISMASVHSVSVDYQAFQDIMKPAILAVQGNMNAVAPQNVIDAGAKVINSITTVKGAVK